MTPESERVRVLKVVPTLRCGGTERQFMALSGSLDERRFDLRLACLRGEGPFAAEARQRGLPLQEYPIGPFRSLRTLALQAQFSRDLVQQRIDIVHAYNFYGNVFAIPPARIAGTPVIVASIRDRGLYLTAMQVRVQRWLCRAATRILVNANAVRDWLIEQGHDPGRIVVTPNGVDLDRFDVPVDRAAIRREFGLAPGTPIVTVVSRLHPLKGLESFLDAAAILAPRFPLLRFLVVGEPADDDGGYRDTLIGRATALGLGERVLFAGLRSDIPAILASSTVSVMPSLNEALPNVLLESMAAGVPTVSTRVGGTAEAMTNGVNGLLVSPGDVRALAAAIDRLLRDRSMAATLVRAARQVVEERFSLARMVESTERLYVDLIAERRSGRLRIPHPLDASRPTR